VSQKYVTIIFHGKFTKIFGTLITKSIGHRQVFLVSQHTYLMQLMRVRWEMRLASNNSTTSFEVSELEITVNCALCTLEQKMV